MILLLGMYGYSGEFKNEARVMICAGVDMKLHWREALPFIYMRTCYAYLLLSCYASRESLQTSLLQPKTTAYLRL